MTEAKILSEVYPSFEADVQTNAGNIFTPMITNANMRVRTPKLREEDKEINTNKEAHITSGTGKALTQKTNEKHKSKRKVSINAGKGAINYVQLPN